MSAGLYNYSGIKRPCFSSVQLLLAAASSNLFNQGNISSLSALANIEGRIFVFGLSISAWRSCQNCSFAILFLWKVWELTTDF